MALSLGCDFFPSSSESVFILNPTLMILNVRCRDP